MKALSCFSEFDLDFNVYTGAGGKGSNGNPRKGHMNKSISLLAIGCCFAIAATPVLAQAPGPGGPPAGGAAPAVSAASVALPGDNMGTGMRMGPPPGGRPGGPPGGPPGGAGGRPPQEPGSNAPSPTLAVAIEAAEKALSYCKAQGYNIGVAVVDSTGQPRVGLAQDKASGGHIYTAVRKDLTAVAFKKPSGQVQATDAGVTPKMATMAGAIPLFSASGELLGAIAGSGASSQQDEKCAQAGADAVKGQL